MCGQTARAKKGFVLLPNALVRRWVVERSFAWATRFYRLAKDYERLPETLAGLHYMVLPSSCSSRIPQYSKVHNML